MSILVTGCAGFIGSHVCRLLLERGDSVSGIDNLNDAYDVRLKRWRLEGLLSHRGFRFWESDISDIGSLRAAFEGGDGGPPFEAVVNLGARAGVRASVEDPRAYYESNTIGTLNLLELCRASDVSKFVLASTSSVYGADTPRPFREDSDTSRPLSPYAASKKAAETLVYSYHHLYGLDATVLRYFTVYGPAGRPDMSIFKFIRAIAEGEPITVYGDGKQERDFTYVDDIAAGTVAAIIPLGYEIINLGSDRPVVLSDVIGMIEAYLERKASIQHSPAHSTDVRATWAHIGRAKELLGWRPEVSLEEGIRRTAEWYRRNREWAKEIE
jgi:nucleoside-diphosphate-sugar epimerase